MKLKSFIDEIFDLKSEKFSEISFSDRHTLEKIKDNSITFEDIVEMATNDNCTIEDFKTNFETYLDDIEIENTYENKKMYKHGFVDAFKLMLEMMYI